MSVVQQRTPWRSLEHRNEETSQAGLSVILNTYKVEVNPTCPSPGFVDEALVEALNRRLQKSLAMAKARDES